MRIQGNFAGLMTPGEELRIIKDQPINLCMRRDLVVEHLRGCESIGDFEHHSSLTAPLMRTESALFMAFHSSSAATNSSVMDLEILQ